MSSSVQAQSVSQDLLGRINNLRSSLGLSPYRLNSSLNAAALSHAQWMANTSQVTHIQENGSTPASRAGANGYNSQWVSENIYMGGLASADTAWNFWINSSIHYAGLTSDNFRDVGIATAQGAGGHAFVLVFGVPAGASTVASNSSSSANNQSAAPALPIVGYDEVGNIQYELQAGDTLGQVLLLFGYTWDDLNAMLDLNGLTEADITALDVGQVVLVPPPQGTYTPTPVTETLAAESAEATAEITVEVVEVTEEPVSERAASVEPTTTPPATNNPQADGIIPTPAPDTGVDNTVETVEIAEVTEELLPVEAVGQPVTFVAVTASPTITATPTSVPTLQVNNLAAATTIPESPTAIPQQVAPDRASSNSIPLWLIAAIIVQLAVLGFATFEYFRRKK